jgi:hypothetical protein
MNVAGIPLAGHAQGFWIVIALIAVSRQALRSLRRLAQRR